MRYGGYAQTKLAEVTAYTADCNSHTAGGEQSPAGATPVVSRQVCQSLQLNATNSRPAVAAASYLLQPQRLCRAGAGGGEGVRMVEYGS